MLVQDKNTLLHYSPCTNELLQCYLTCGPQMKASSQTVFYHSTTSYIYASINSESTQLKTFISTFSSVQFSCSVVSDSSWPHKSQHARPPCPSLTPRVHSDSCASSRWCHPAISSSVVPFSSCPQSLPASESFSMSQLFRWGGQSTGVSALASFLPRNTQELPRILGRNDGLVGSPCSPRDSQESSPTPQFKSINSLVLSFLHSPTLISIHDYWKNHSLD